MIHYRNEEAFRIDVGGPPARTDALEIWFRRDGSVRALWDNVKDEGWIRI